MTSKRDDISLDFEGFFGASASDQVEPKPLDTSFIGSPKTQDPVIDSSPLQSTGDAHLQQEASEDCLGNGEEKSPIGFAFPFGGGLNGSGIASIEGGDVIAFSDLSELPVHGKFVVCTPAQGFTVRSGCDHLLPADVYPTLASMLAVEIGCKLVANPADPRGDCGRSVRALAAVYSRADSHFRSLISKAGSRPPRGAHETTSRKMLWLGSSPQAEADNLVAAIAADLNRPILRPQGAAGKRDVTLRLQGGRAAQLQRLLAARLPGIEAIEMPPTIASLQQACRNGEPAFALVSIRSARDAVADVFGKSFAPKGLSFWMPAEEIIAIASGVNMLIERVLCYPDGPQVSQVIGIEPGAIHPLFATSVSAGLACEAILYSATEQDVSNSQLATGFARSHARSEMLKEALEIGKINGVTILDIGLTHLTISIPKQLVTRLRSYLLAARTGLRMPAGWEWAT